MLSRSVRFVVVTVAVFSSFLIAGTARSGQLLSLNDSSLSFFQNLYAATRGSERYNQDHDDRWQRCMNISEVSARDPEGRPYKDIDKLKSCMGFGAGKAKRTAPTQRSTPRKTNKSQDAGNLADTAKVDPAWANDTRKRIAKKEDDPIEIAHMEDNAPYGDPRCAVFKPAPHRGAIDWDWVKVTNRCSYPIGVLFCYYDVGQERDCLPGGKGSWGLGHIAPGKTDTSVATSQRMPWMVKAIVCNMTPLEHNRMLCVLPDSYKKP